MVTYKGSIPLVRKHETVSRHAVGGSIPSRFTNYAALVRLVLTVD